MEPLAKQQFSGGITTSSRLHPLSDGWRRCRRRARIAVHTETALGSAVRAIATERASRPSARPRRGGTAFPIIRDHALRSEVAAATEKKSGKVWSRAASRGVNVLGREG